SEPAIEVCAPARGAALADDDESALTLRAVISRALPLHAMLDRRSAQQARLARAFVNVQFLSEIPRHALRIHIVAQRRAAGADRILEHGLDRCHEPLDFLTWQFSR